MDIRPLLDAIISAFLLLEESSDDDVDPDVAVRGMEDMAACLNRLSEKDRIEVRRVLEGMALSSRRPEYAELARWIPGAIGWDAEARG